MTHYALLLLMASLPFAACFHNFVAPSRMDALLKDERAPHAVRLYIAEQNTRLSRIRQLLNELNELVSEANFTVDHPIYAYAFVSLAAKLKKVVSSKQHIERYKERVAGLRLPTHADLVGTAQNIDNIRSVYELSYDDVIRGNVLGRKARPLSAQDVFFIGDSLFAIKNLHRARVWLEKSTKIPGSDVQDKMVLPKLARCYEQSNDIESLMKTLVGMKNDGVDRQSLDNYVTYLDVFLSETKVPAKMAMESDMERYVMLCRNNRNEGGDSRSTGCSYRALILPYVRAKVEVLSSVPYVVFYHDVINDRENDVLTKVAKKALSAPQNQVGSDVTAASKQYSHATWAMGKGLMTRLTRRMSQITGLSATVDTGMYQIVEYGTGAFDFPLIEVDNRPPTNETQASVRYTKATGLASFVLYLRTAAAGGSRVFNRAGLSFDGVKNGVMMWYNQHRSGDTDWTSMQSSCPVVHGSQLVMKKWFEHSEQTFSHPCALERFSVDI